eukprot:TRINITY_DN2426_c0_g1_i1.p1 TRINITY_DN2426_c0_g1~~TRINITY_DN2426_c0_g1_i1.p1  ORF type:complete len:303 (+),score=7.58 TRINITY_DN2426_c0_g1_i1:88-996(+)
MTAGTQQRAGAQAPDGEQERQRKRTFQEILATPVGLQPPASAFARSACSDAASDRTSRRPTERVRCADTYPPSVWPAGSAAAAVSHRLRRVDTCPMGRPQGEQSVILGFPPPVPPSRRDKPRAPRPQPAGADAFARTSVQVPAADSPKPTTPLLPQTVSSSARVMQPQPQQQQQHQGEASPSAGWDKPLQLQVNLADLASEMFADGFMDSLPTHTSDLTSWGVPKAPPLFEPGALQLSEMRTVMSHQSTESSPLDMHSETCPMQHTVPAGQIWLPSGGASPLAASSPIRSPWPETPTPSRAA